MLSLTLYSYNHGQMSWDTFAFLGRFQIHTGRTPPLTPQTMLDACIQIFFRVSTLYWMGGGRSARKFWKWCTVLRGNREMTEKYAYCSTVQGLLYRILVWEPATWYCTSMLWSIDSCQNRHLLTSITWPSRGSSADLSVCVFFLKLSADKLLVSKRSQVQLQFLSSTGNQPLSQSFFP